MSDFHIPVLPNEAIRYLNVQKNAWYIDCNLGGGGHTELILQKGGKVLGIDLDPDSINAVASEHSLKFQNYHDRKVFENEGLKITQDNFINIKQIAGELNIKPSGILFDLGISSHQLGTPERGFSFNKDAPLDMRMNPNFGATAADLINGLHEGELSELFEKYGEENFAKRIAKKIVETRKTKKIESTKELADLIKRSLPRSNNKIHPATKVFQALRIAVNDELNALRETLPQAFELLEPGGRIVVISFHSLEDRIVKNYFNSLCHPVEPASSGPIAKILTDKPIMATLDEQSSNPRSRSAKMRALEKKL